MIASDDISHQNGAERKRSKPASIQINRIENAMMQKAHATNSAMGQPAQSFDYEKMVSIATIERCEDPNQLVRLLENYAEMKQSPALLQTIQKLSEYIDSLK